MDHFTLDVGRVTILGVAPLTQHRTCIAGLPCHIHGITGNGLADGDKVLVLHTCGHVAHVNGFPGYGSMQDVSMSGASVFWTSPVTALGGRYRLCWCSFGQHCSSGEQFRTDFGSFTLVGPSSSDQDRTCIAGMSCAVGAIAGQDLSALNQYVILDTCGVASTIGGMPSSLHTAGFNAAMALSVTAVAGQYRLCWCSGMPDWSQAEFNSTQNETNSTNNGRTLSFWNQSLVNLSAPTNHSSASYCQTAAEFRIDVGSLLVVGAATSASDFTCIAGRDCELDHIVGISLHDGDSIVVLDTCGEPGAALQPRALANGTHAAWETITTPGGVYRLCWCSVSKLCRWAEDFDLDIGRLYVLGPRPLLQDRTCVSGTACAVQGIETHGVLQAGSVAILSTCGDGTDGTNLWAGMPVSFTSLQEPGSSQFLANLVTDVEMTAAGGQYQLCWCGSWAGGCDWPEDFNVHFGNFLLVGVSPLQQDRTCFTGATCALADISGHGISQSAVLVMETCGLGRATLMRSWDEASVSSASGSVTTWAMQPSGPGGQYRLCWCSRQPCSVQDAIVDFGQLTLVGPAPLYQHHTCLSGLECQLTGLTGTFWSGDVWVLATCGTQSGMISRFAQDGRSPISIPDAVVNFQEPVTAAGGQYRLCWCSDGSVNQSNWTHEAAQRGCDFASDFGVDMGALLLLGMSPLTQDRTCIAGQSCHLADLRGFGLSSLDTIAVLDTCGQQALRHWPAEPTTILETDGKLTVSWSFVTAAGGQYRLCWCPGVTWTTADEEDEDFDPWTRNDTLNSSVSVQTFERRCSSAELLRVDFGSLTLVGPTPLYQQYTCVSGQTCELQHVEGLHLEEGDRIQLLETCAVTQKVPLRVPGGGLLTASAVGNNSLSFSLGDAPISGFGGTYRLCWCSAAVDCALEAFRVDIGQLTVLGTHPPSQGFTCVSGRQCRIDGISGLFAESSAFMVLDTCGRGASIEQGQIVQSPTGSSLSWESGMLRGSGGQYRLCWCGSSETTQIQADNSTNSSPSMMRTLGCDTSKDFLIDAGEIHLLGPALDQARTCIGGQLCRIEGLVGYGLAEADRLLVMNSCGTAELPTGFPSTGTSVVLSNITWGANSSSLWDSVITGPGGTYRLCWCTAWGSSCSAFQDFLLDVGEFTLLGPSPLEQHRTCVSGRACFLTPSPDHGLEGLGVNPSDGLLAIPLTSTCGTLGAKRVEGVTTNLSMPDPGGSSPAAVAQAVTRISEPGGLYRLCWCSSAALSCMTEHHSIQVGLLSILGPAPLSQDRSCISGRTCMVDISGSFVDAQLEGMLMVLGTCGLPDLLPRFLPDGMVPLTGTETNTNLSLRISAAGGLYRLCWCATSASSLMNESLANVSLEACSEPSDFLVDAAASETVVSMAEVVHRRQPPIERQLRLGR